MAVLRQKSKQPLYASLYWLAERCWTLLLAPLWMLLIYYLSAMPGDESAKLSDKFLVRKLAHFTEYGILALLFLIFWAALFHLMRRKKSLEAWCLGAELQLLPLAKLLALAWVSATFYAVTDEWHQIFVPGRVGSLRDVVLDSAGALFFLIVALLLLLWEQGRSERRY